MIKAFLIEMGEEPISENLEDEGIELVSSIFKAEAIILHRGNYCCKEDCGYLLLNKLLLIHPEKKFYVVYGRPSLPCSMNQYFYTQNNIFDNSNGKFDFNIEN